MSLEHLIASWASRWLLVGVSWLGLRAWLGVSQVLCLLGLPSGVARPGWLVALLDGLLVDRGVARPLQVRLPFGAGRVDPLWSVWWAFLVEARLAVDDPFRRWRLVLLGFLAVLCVLLVSFLAASAVLRLSRASALVLSLVLETPRGLVFGWLTRSLPRVPGNTVVSRTDGQPVYQAPTEAGGSGVNRNAPVSAHLTCVRFRRRARWVNRCASRLGLRRGSLGFVLRGRWTPDLPSPRHPAAVNSVLSHFEDGARLLGGGVVRCSRSSEGSLREEVDEPYHLIELSDGSREVCFPGLLSKLSAYALLRQRDAVLISALRLRALDWVKRQGLPKDLGFIVVASAMRLALEVPCQEAALAETLEDLGPGSPRWWHRA